MSEARASTRSAQRWERLICQDRIRAACSGASSPPSPTQSGPGAPGIFGARHAGSRCARGVSRHAPRAPTASGGDLGSAPRDGRGPQSQGQPSATSPPAHPCREEGQSGPTQLPPAPWEGSLVRPPEREAADPVPRRAWHSAFPQCAPGKGRIQLCHPNAASSSFSLEPRAIRRGDFPIPR